MLLVQKVLLGTRSSGCIEATKIIKETVEQALQDTKGDLSTLLMISDWQLFWYRFRDLDKMDAPYGKLHQFVQDAAKNAQYRPYDYYAVTEKLRSIYRMASWHAINGV